MKVQLRNVCLALAAFGCIASGAVLALDNTINNDFWDTRAYVNASPNEQAGVFEEALDARTESAASSAMPAGTTLDTFFFTAQASNSLERLFTMPRALAIYLR